MLLDIFVEQQGLTPPDEALIVEILIGILLPYTKHTMLDHA